jgi:hypothetical protein
MLLMFSNKRDGLLLTMELTREPTFDAPIQSADDLPEMAELQQIVTVPDRPILLKKSCCGWGRRSWRHVSELWRLAKWRT